MTTASGDATQHDPIRGRAEYLVFPGVAPERTFSPRQIEAIRMAMALFVEDDLARGTLPGQRLYCDACERVRSAAGFVRYVRYSFCNVCATEYEVARTRGVVVTPGQYLRDKRFGDGDLHALPD
jgi:hypothetical protein